MHVHCSDNVRAQTHTGVNWSVYNCNKTCLITHPAWYDNGQLQLLACNLLSACYFLAGLPSKHAVELRLPSFCNCSKTFIMIVIIVCMAGKGSAGAMQVLLNHWSSSDYLQLVTEKVTAFEREQRELSVVPFGQVSTTLTALLSVYDTTCAQALCAGSEPASAQSPCTMTGMSACSNSYITSSAFVSAVTFSATGCTAHQVQYPCM